MFCLRQFSFQCKIQSPKIALGKNVSRLRNIGISAHIDSGKTTLTERILYYSGRIDKMHEVKGKDKVGATMDFMELERERGITIQSAATYTRWKNHIVNIIDTPGHVDFTIEVERALRVLDGGVLIICSVGGIQSQTLTVWKQMNRYKIPIICFLNKIDRSFAKPLNVALQISKQFQINSALINIPLGIGSENNGIIDIIEKKIIYFDQPFGLNLRYENINEKDAKGIEFYRNNLIQNLAAFDPNIERKFINEENIDTCEIYNAIKFGVKNRIFMPILVGSALKNKGIQLLLDCIIRYLPSPDRKVNQGLKIINETETKFNLKCCQVKDENLSNPLVMLGFKLDQNKFGFMVFCRIYQGVLKKGDKVFNSRTNKKQNIVKIAKMNASILEEIEDALAGDVVAVFGLENCQTGDTFTSIENRNTYLESMTVPSPVVSMKLIIDSKTNDNKNLFKGLLRFQKEDPTFKLSQNLETKELIISGMGELHLDIYCQRLRREYGILCHLGKPSVSLRETLSEYIEFDYKHKKQTGGHGEYGRVFGKIEPILATEDNISRMDSVEFIDKTTGTSLPKPYIPSIIRGMRKAFNKGNLAGQKVSAIKVIIDGGDHHHVDSSDSVFEKVGYLAVQQCFERGNWSLLEPLMRVSIEIPGQFINEIIRIMNSRNGSLLYSSFDECSENDLINIASLIFEAPLNFMFNFTSELRRYSQGKGEFTMEFVRYVPAHDQTHVDAVKNYQNT